MVCLDDNATAESVVDGNYNKYCGQASLPPVEVGSTMMLKVGLSGSCALGLGEIGPQDPNFKIKTWALGF